MARIEGPNRRTFVVGIGEERWSLSAEWVTRRWVITEAHSATGEEWRALPTFFPAARAYDEVIDMARRWAWDRIGS